MDLKRPRTTESEIESEAGPSKKTTVPVSLLHYSSTSLLGGGESSPTLPGGKSSTSLPGGGEADTATASASHHSSTSLPGGTYEVFLNFRGPDTRFNFTDFLYHFLDIKGVRTFRDNEEIRKGEEMGPELLKAIRESRISIPILSKDYASSKWCLKELTLMVECKRTMGQVILPIFYDVTPSEVKDQSGSYGKALEKHMESGEISHETIDQWKNALGYVGRLKGWDLKAEGNQCQGELIKDKIVQEVLSVLKPKLMDVTENLVGMDHHKNEMMRLLGIDSDVVKIVGIYGMGGIGKTTVAKVMYNKLVIENKFNCYSFLLNVQEWAKTTEGLVSLQDQLLIDILNGRHENTTNIDSKKATIQERFGNKKVLLVLDDVDSKSQFHYLVGKGCNFGEGSKIIITTKNRCVLNDLKIQCTYELPIMNAVQSLQLFSKNAFGKESPPDEYVNISKKIACVAGGLPLALESMGSYLCEKDPQIWEAASEKFAETPSDGVWEKLIVDYEGLNKDQQDIFLDVACLFAGMDKTTVFYMWEACKYHPIIAFDELKLRCLVKVIDSNKLWMHDQLIALGKKIVNEEKYVGKRSRLWNHEEALEILEGEMGTDKIEALSLSFDLECEEKPCFRSNDFAKLRNLRYLRLGDADLEGDFDQVLKSLKWLNWPGCPPIFKPTKFHMKKLAILDLPYSCITEDWEGWNQIQMAESVPLLRCLSFYGSKRRLLPASNPGLTQIPRIPNMGDISNFTRLVLNLKDLQFFECDNLVEMSRDIGKLSKLERLTLHGTKIRSLPEDIGFLTQLKVLDIRCCEHLQCILGLPSSLIDLSLAFCHSLEKLPHLSNLKKLSNLLFTNCDKLAEVEGLEKLESLTSLYISACKMLAASTNLSDLSNLRNFSNCYNLRKIEGLEAL